MKAKSYWETRCEALHAENERLTDEIASTEWERSALAAIAVFGWLVAVGALLWGGV